MELTPDLDENYFYSVKELAYLWNLSDESIRRIFMKEPGVMILPTQRLGRRIYRTIRIPGQVAIRVRNRSTVVDSRQ
jgi:hypothetical protein